MVVVLAVAVAVVGAAWWGLASQRSGDVSVAWGAATAGPVTCRDAAVTERRSQFGDGRAPVLPLDPGMDCVMPVTVFNRGSGAVRLDAVVLPYMGPEAGPEVQVPELADLPREPSLSDDGLHAAFRVDRPLGPGESYRFAIHFAYRDDGCSDGTLWLEHFPEVSVSSLGLSGTVEGPAVGFTGTGTAPGCA